jgi:alpha/beta superfamily hydrolase
MREPKELVVIAGADHLFNGKTMQLGEAVEDLLEDFDGRTAREPQRAENSGD